MKTIFALSVLIFFASCSKGYAENRFSAVVTRIIDGDSIIVRTNEIETTIRLYGIDCPEWNQPVSVDARSTLSSWILNKNVIVFPYYSDTYGRLVSQIYLEDESINGKLVQAGMAWVYPYFCKKKICKKWHTFQATAQKDKVGLWLSENPTPPWIWKRQK